MHGYGIPFEGAQGRHATLHGEDRLTPPQVTVEERDNKG
jgi:hypothetical protein